MLVRQLLFSVQALEGVPDHTFDVFSGRSQAFRTNVSPAPEFDTAGFTFGDGVIGVVIGEFKDGSAARLALKADGEFVF